MKVLTARDGDREVTWDAGKKEDVESARADFDRYRQLGYKAYEMDPKTRKSKGGELKTFDPSIEYMILIPQMQGG
jgi:hypothetical protein